MQQFSSSQSRPVALSSSIESQVYFLFAIAMALSGFGVYIGFVAAPTLVLSGGVLLVAMIAELAIIFTSSWWSRATPLNYLLFGLFPILSGFTFTPYLMALLAGYVNGGSILLNATVATASMALAASIFARTTSWNLGVFQRGLFIGLIGLLLLGILQIFFAPLRSTGAEILISGIGIVIFAGFLAFDLQRIAAMGRAGASPFILALSLYLDIFNLFVSVLRLMVAISGQRR